MRSRWLPVLLILIVAAVASADDEKKSSLKPGDDLPGPFRPYNVTGKFGERVVKELGGKDKEVEGQFHCLVCDHGLSPVAMVLVRNIDLAQPPEGLVELLKQLNVAVQKNRRARLGSFVIVLSDDLPDVVTDDEKRFDLAGKLKDLDKRAELNQGENMVLALESKKYLGHYPLDETAAAIVLLYNEHKVFEVIPLTREKLGDKDEAAREVLGKVKAMLTPK